MTDDEISKLSEKLVISFYQDWGFWIGVFLSLIGILFSVKAFIEAKKARQAALEAGRTVKIQTVTIELTEIAQRLDKLNYDLNFSDARDLLNEISRRLRRLIAPFQSSDDFLTVCCELKTALEDARVALDGVRPADNQAAGLPPNAVYFATQGHFSIISALVAEITGLFEKRNIEG